MAYIFKSELKGLRGPVRPFPLLFHGLVYQETAMSYALQAQF